jgi:Immunoglobulin-like domain of bacterial spore germination
MIEDRIRRALDAHDPGVGEPPPWSAVEEAAAVVRAAHRRRRLVVSAVAAALVVVVGAAAVLALTDRDDGRNVVTEQPQEESTTTSTTEAPTTTTSPPTTVAPFPDPASVDGIYPDRKAYERSGVSAFADARAAATAFVKDYLGMKTPVLREVDGDTWTVRPNARATLTTTLTLARVGADGPWTVTGATTPGIVVRAPVRLASVASPLSVTGSAWAFEGHVDVQVREDGMKSGAFLGQTFVTGGGDQLRPFSGRVTFRKPGAGVAAGAVVFVEPSAEDGSVMSATVVRVRFGAPSAPAGLNGDSALRLDGVGPVTFGMTVAEAKAAAKVDLRQSKLPACTALSSVGSLSGLDLLAPDGEPVRYAVVKGGPFKTEEGIGVGSTQQAVIDAYPDAEVRETRIVRLSDSAAMVFHMDSGKVASMWSGPRDSANADELCS